MAFLQTKVVVAGFLLLLGTSLSGICYAHSWQTSVIKTETPDRLIDIQYPKANQGVKIAVEALIKKEQDDFLEAIKSLPALPVDLPGKNGLTIRYKVVFDKPKCLSLLFSISSFTKGAAHPANNLVSLNFINGQKVTLDKLFKSDSNYLPAIAAFAKSQLLARKISDNDWIIKGSLPTMDNYDLWTFSEQGLAVIFDTYQVAAYVYGPQTVLVNKQIFSSFLNPQIDNQVWGH